MGSFMASLPASPIYSSDHAALADPPGPQRFPVPPAQRVVWPWPTFLLGVVALVGIWFARPYLRPTDGDRIHRDLNEMRNLLNRTSPDLTRAMALGRKTIE